MEAVVIGLTGGIACGKSSVARMLAAKGAAIIDADWEAKALMMTGGPTWTKVVAEFGREILRADGSIDSKVLGGIVFANPEKLAKLNALVHPDAIDRIRGKIKRLQAAGRWPAIVLDVPLLFEAGAEKLVDYSWAVTVSPPLQIERLLAREPMSIDQARQRVAAQMAPAEKAARADEVIDNSGSLEQTEMQVAALWQKYVAGK